MILAFRGLEGRVKVWNGAWRMRVVALVESREGSVRRLDSGFSVLANWQYDHRQVRELP